MMHSEGSPNAASISPPMISSTAEEFLGANHTDASSDGPAGDRPATMSAALLVSPIGFRVSEESAEDNRYMHPGTTVDLERAHDQHHRLARLLGNLGLPVVVLPGQEGLDDAAFPNNVYATVPGRFIVGSMRHDVRRAEAERDDVRSLFKGAFAREVVDLSKRDCVAALTGPRIIDRRRALGFCGMTGRVDDAGVEAMHEAFDLEHTFRFDLASDEYHTNLVLSVLASRACVLHRASFANPAVADAIAQLYPDRTLELDDDEKAAFAGNCIALTDRDVVFSATSVKRLRRESRKKLESWGFRVHGAEVDEFEKGGGSLRCLIAEIF